MVFGWNIMHKCSLYYLISFIVSKFLKSRKSNSYFTQGFYIQAITNYKYSDNVARTRVATIFVPFLREVQLREIVKGFDEQASAVMLARMASKKAEV